jgi:DNA invertase Pin-like site-specific DNA recombinase
MTARPGASATGICRRSPALSSWNSSFLQSGAAKIEGWRDCRGWWRCRDGPQAAPSRVSPGSACTAARLHQDGPAIDRSGQANRLSLVAEHYDAAVSGADPIEGREGFAALLDRIENNGVRTVIVEDASGFARELVVQELGIALLAKRGVRLLTASGDDLTDSDDLGRKMMRQVAGAFAEYEKGRLVAKLRSGRQRKRLETGKKVGSRKSHAELWPEAVALAKRLRRASPKTGERLSFREISTRLKDAGHVNEHGQHFNQQSVRAMIEGPQPRSVTANEDPDHQHRRRLRGPRPQRSGCHHTQVHLWQSPAGETRGRRVVCGVRELPDLRSDGRAETVMHAWPGY